MKRISLFVILIVAVWLTGVAQTVITGTVLNAQGEGMDAYVTASAKGGGNIIGFADTDSKGRFKLEFQSSADSIVVIADGMGIGQQVKTVANLTQKLDFLVESKTIQLKEVSVRAQKITQQGDTLNYLVGAFQQQADRTIGDVLKRMPGIEVSDNGGIRFNGRSISKFYVEDMDLLAGRYGLATNNVSASDVATVQVLENHQPVKMLQGQTLSDDVAINLKLKDSAKGTVAVNAMLGAGVQQANTIGKNPLWIAEFVCMYFAKRRQNMTLYKGNNTGDDVSKELTQHRSDIIGVALYPLCPTGVVMPDGSGLPQKRTFDNLSHILTMNHLERFNKDKELSLNIAYHNDRIRREGSSEGDYFLSDDSRLMTTETLYGETKVNNLNAQLRYNWNAPGGFVADVLKFDANWNSDRVDGLLSSERTGADPLTYGNDRVRQHFDRPQLSVSNTFNTIRSIGKNSFNLHFSAGYAQRSNTLTVGIDSLMKGTQGAYVQDVDSRHIAGRFNTSYSIRVAEAFRFDYGINASANLHGIVTDLDGFTPPTSDPQLTNNLWYNTYCLSLGQSYKYEKRDFDIALSLPLELYTQTLDDKVRKDRHSYTRLLFSPSLSLNWIIVSDLCFNARAYYSKSVGNPEGIYSGYIMSNYRTFQRSYVEHLSETKNCGASAGFRYQSAINALFASVSINYHHANDNQIYGYSYDGATSVVHAIDRPTTADSYTVNGEASKGFDFLNSSLRLSGGYGLSENERLIDNNLYRYHARRISFGGTLSLGPFEGVSLAYACGFGWSSSFTRGNRDQSFTLLNRAQRITMNVYPTKILTLTLMA